jgi:pilus assembly protein CpaB
MVLTGSRKTAAPGPTGPKLTQVVTAERDVAAGEALADSDLSTGQVVADSAPANSFTDQSTVAGRVTVVPLVKGQTILDSLLAPKGATAGLQAAIPPGMRAVTIDINETSGVGGYITAGSHVDLLQTLHTSNDSPPFTRCLVQDVLVQAVGAKGVTGTDFGTVHSLTLLVTPRQAELIELSSANGRPRLTLRNDRDNQTVEVPVVTQRDLTGEPPKIAEVVAPKPPDPFVPATRPSEMAATPPPIPVWPVRVITAGQPGLVNLRLPPPAADATVDTKEVNNP